VVCLKSTAEEENRVHPKTNIKTRQKIIKMVYGESPELFLINYYNVDANKKIRCLKNLYFANYANTLNFLDKTCIWYQIPNILCSVDNVVCLKNVCVLTLPDNSCFII
jgi:hypothetical protein